MTLNDLCECSADVLEPLIKNQEQLDAICSPYWNVTRPEQAAKERVMKPIATPEEMDKAAKKKKALEMMDMFNNPAVIAAYKKKLQEGN